jgi:hypothetical protein
MSTVVWLVGPYVLDDRALDGAVEIVAITWSEAGRAAAEEQLRFELDAAGVGSHVSDDACGLVDADIPVVRCEWGVEVDVPGTSWVVPLAFESEASLDGHGQSR